MYLEICELVAPGAHSVTSDRQLYSGSTPVLKGPASWQGLFALFIEVLKPLPLAVEKVTVLPVY
jgi:hypothetical protein